MSRICISSGHGLKVRGASGIIDEVDEARRLVDHLADELESRGVDVFVFHDNSSTSQSQNLTTICNAHNAQTRDVDCSIHFNAFEQVTKPMGCEVLYVTQHDLAAKLSSAISKAGHFINRGAKKRTDLKFLNATEEPAVLLEICFVDSEADCELYEDHFDAICDAIADVFGGEEDEEEIEVEPIPPDSPTFYASGRCSYFGGPDDMGVSDQEGLAFIFKVQDAPHLFLPEGTPGTSNKGLARKLNPYTHYVACRWDYNRTPKPTLLQNLALVRSLKTGMALTAFPADWGPHEEKTGRVADLSPQLMKDLGIVTDDEVEVIYPWHEGDDRWES